MLKKIVKSTSSEEPDRNMAMPAVLGGSSSEEADVYPVVVDEDMLPFENGSCDLVVSSLGLHWVNDLPLAINECSRVLKEDGLFLAALFAEDTLSELRVSCTLAHEVSKLSSHPSPT